MTHTRIQPRALVLVALIGLVALTRLLPHPPNFTPLLAIALFAGALFADRRLAVLVPLAALLLTDALLGWHATWAFVYGSVALASLLGLWGLRNRRSVARVGGFALGGSVLFFVLTNLGVWLVQDLYPPTPAGLSACFLAAIPFFHNTLLSTLVYCVALFGGLALAERSGVFAGALRGSR